MSWPQYAFGALIFWHLLSNLTRDAHKGWKSDDVTASFVVMVAESSLLYAGGFWEMRP